MKSNTKLPKSSGNSFRSTKSQIGNRKKDKRIIRRSALLSRIEKPIAPLKKRRRPSKKLITDLESLADALPEVPPIAEKELDASAPRIKYKSFRSKPGAMKRKELLINQEKERFNQNMVALHKGTENMTSRGEADDAHRATKQKWTTIREFIQQTMEKHVDSELLTAERVTSERSTQ